MTGPDDQAPVSAAGLEVFDPSPVGVLVTRGPEHELVYQSPAHRAIFGARALGRPVREAFADVENIGEYVALFDRVFRTGEAATSIDTRISADHPDNSADDERSFTFSVSRFPVGQAAGLLVIITESTDRVQRTEQDRFLDDTRRKVARRYRTLGEIGAQMVMVADPAGSVVEESAGWEAVTGQSFEEYQGFGWLHRVHPDDREQLLEVARDAMERRTPILEHTLRLRTVTGENRYFLLRAVPVFERDQVLEWVGVFTDIETQLIAVRRERLLDKAAAATSGLAQPEEMLTALAEVIVPDIVDSCRVYLVRDDPQRAPGDPFVIDPVASVLAEGLPQVEEHGPEGRGPQTLPGQAILQRRPSLVTFPPGEPPGHIAPRYIRRWVAEARANCMAWLPVIVDGTVAAVAAVFGTGNRPPLSDNDLQLMTDILEHAHDALSSALAFRRTQQIALALQRSFLTDPPDVPGLAVAARYQPTPAGAEVGGDWYDAFTLPDGTLVLSIGDVAGHDLPAAVTMGHVRTMLRGFAVDTRASAGATLQRLDAALQTLYEDRTATCILGRIDVLDDGSATLDYAVAGHLPPLLVESDGTTRFLEGHRHPLLGATAEMDYEHDIETLPHGSTLLLYTDGLIELRGEHLERGLERLQTMASALATTPVETFCDELLANLPIAGDDDIALIAVRVPGEDSRHAEGPGTPKERER